MIYIYTLPHLMQIECINEQAISVDIQKKSYLPWVKEKGKTKKVIKINFIYYVIFDVGSTPHK